jgi:hypothetical protein
MAKAPNGAFSFLYICARETKLALFSKASEPHSLEVFQRWRAHHGHGHRSSRQVPGCRAHVGVIGPGVATDSNTIDLSYSPHHARRTPPTAPHPKRPQSTHRIIPRTGQFGTVSELKPSHTLLCFTIEAHGKHANTSSRLLRWDAGAWLRMLQMSWLRDLTEESECSGSQPAA